MGDLCCSENEIRSFFPRVSREREGTENRIILLTGVAVVQLAAKDDRCRNKLSVFPLVFIDPGTSSLFLGNDDFQMEPGIICILFPQTSSGRRRKKDSFPLPVSSGVMLGYLFHEGRSRRVAFK